nr:immunoglobulin light chain junction region [Macaca mulatta]MOW08479.1 immunoglobulin light chain junction region [Macaca mulatta]MOW10505.1 immunoglobulin light chain junction region [Macaca mulatta]MOW10610.1 immunoglobulin light chain junction region [Macaca mulatta]MOW11288.1 immunoglobulin light chain junction region [Macaca mulatta]
CQQHNSDPWTF